MRSEQDGRSRIYKRYPEVSGEAARRRWDVVKSTAVDKCQAMVLHVVGVGYVRVVVGRALTTIKEQREWIVVVMMMTVLSE